MTFESRLATRIAARKDDGNAIKGIVTLAGVIFIVLTLTSSTMAVPQAVIQVGSKNSVANYMGQYDGIANVVMLGALSVNDWASIKVPVKGHLSDISSISYSILVSQTGGVENHEPFVVLKLTEGRFLVCHPEDSYSADLWNFPYFSWQLRDIVSQGKWTRAPVDTESLALSLENWVPVMGDADVISISINIGRWDISSPYQCYLGDLTINDKHIGISNAGRSSGGSADLPPGF